MVLVMRGHSYASSADRLARRFTFFLYATDQGCTRVGHNDLQGKFSRTSLAASTFAGEFKSGTSADNNEITEMS